MTIESLGQLPTRLSAASIYSCVVCVAALLFYSYRSTDFEVENWFIAEKFTSFFYFRFIETGWLSRIHCQLINGTRTQHPNGHWITHRFSHISNSACQLFVRSEFLANILEGFNELKAFFFFCKIWSFGLFWP
jgi:hypothetical protein